MTHLKIPFFGKYQHHYFWLFNQAIKTNVEACRGHENEFPRFSLFLMLKIAIFRREAKAFLTPIIYHYAQKCYLKYSSKTTSFPEKYQCPFNFPDFSHIIVIWILNKTTRHFPEKISSPFQFPQFFTHCILSAKME